MANHPIHINDQWVTIVGEVTNPRYVWIMDRVGMQIARDTEGYGFDSRDQLAIFSVGTFRNVRQFLDLKQADFSSVRAFVFMMLGQDELAVDAPPPGFNDVVEGWFHPKGPRQIKLDIDVPSVVASYAKLLDSALSQFPSATFFTTEPAMRRSGFGFAVKWAVRIGRLACRDDEHHHHMIVGRHLYGRRRGKDTGLGDGGALPIKEHFFENNGVLLTEPAMRNILGHMKEVVDAALRPQGNPASIDGVKFVY